MIVIEGFEDFCLESHVHLVFGYDAFQAISLIFKFI